ncbi:MAG: DNA primase [Bacteroidales bacterium]|nr:DNA primase [Bacteroidales bacterium]
MIDRETVAKIIDTAEIVDVVEDFITLKKRGVNYLGLCPFHNEKTPSFTVSPAKGIYKCFGCGKGGNAVTFVMEHEHLNYVEALKFLAKKYHIEIVEKELTADEVQQRNERDSLMIVSGFAQKYFTEQLHETPQGKNIGLSYFKQREFKDEIIEKFQCGYCPDKKDAFTKEALSKGYKLDFLEKTGLTISKNNYNFDRFNGRIIFPIHNLMGKVIAFGGRTLITDKKIAKYLNSPESEIYHKSNVLYGIYFAKNSIVKNDKCYLVEGYTDVISLHQSKIENVVASSGTSLTTEQIRLIKRFTNNVTIIYDGDAAGIKASLRGIDLILEQGMSVRVVPLPENEDPDSFSKKRSPIELNDYIQDNEKDFIWFKTNLLLKEASNDPVKKANLISEVVRTIAIIPDRIVQSVYIKECSGQLSISEQALYSQLNKIRWKKHETQKRRQYNQAESFTEKTQSSIPAFVEDVYSELEEQAVIRLLIMFGSLVIFTKNEDYEEVNTTVAQFIIDEILNDELEFKNLVYQKVFEIYQKYLVKGETLDERFFINHEEENICKLAADVLTPKNQISKIWSKHGSYVETEEMLLKDLVPKTVLEFKNKIIQKAITDLYTQIQESQQQDDYNKTIELTTKLQSLIILRKTIAEKLGNRIIV